MKNLTHQEILQELGGLLTGRWITDLANTSALIYQHFPDINWVGFYLYDQSNLQIKDQPSEQKPMWLGPFQGLPACTMIPYSKGVCGKAALEKKSVRVEKGDFSGNINRNIFAYSGSPRSTGVGFTGTHFHIFTSDRYISILNNLEFELILENIKI